MTYIFVNEYSLIILIIVIYLTNNNFLHPHLGTCIPTLLMYSIYNDNDNSLFSKL